MLQALFTMAVKGGTSLSRVFGAIARCSEDVGVTRDYRGLHGAFDAFAKGVSHALPDRAGGAGGLHWQ